MSGEFIGSMLIYWGLYLLSRSVDGVAKAIRETKS